METLQTRIELVIQAAGWETNSEIAKIAGVSRSAVAQWRGQSSKEIKSIALAPALRLQEASGFSAEWISRGEGPRMLKDRVAAVASEATTQPDSPSLDAALDRVGMELARDMPQTTRDELCDAMAGWARHRGIERWRTTVHAILTQPAAGAGNRRTA